MGMDFSYFFPSIIDILIDLLPKCNFNKHYPNTLFSLPPNPDKLLLVFPVYYSNLKKGDM